MADELKYAVEGDTPTLLHVEAWKAVVDRLNVLSKMTVNGGSLSVSSANAVLTIDASGGGGLPEGYVETSITLCTDSGDVPGRILFKPDP